MLNRYLICVNLLNSVITQKFQRDLRMKKLQISVAIIMFALSVFGQNAGKIRGKITNPDNKAVAGASVSLEGTSLKTVTDANGNFTFENVGFGEYALNVTSDAFLPQSQNISVNSGEILRIDFKLERLTETVQVIGRISEYHTDDTTVAAKIPTRLIDTPQAITSISPQLILDSAATDDKDIYRHAAGLNQSTYSAVVFRGFTQRETLFNGVRGNPYGSLEGDVNNAGFSTSILRLSNVERIEVLKGPASVLYGSSEPGGILNFITKRPLSEFDGTASLRFGEYGLAAGNFDVSVPLAKNLYSRFAFFLEERGSFRRNAGLKNQNYIGNLLWQPGERTRVFFEYEFIRQNQQAHRLRGIPVTPDGIILTDISWTVTEPTDFVNLDANVFQANLSQDFALDGRFEATFRYLTNDRGENYHEPRGLLADGRSMTREFREQFRSNKDWSFTANLYKPFTFKNSGTHTFNAGAEYYTQDHLFIFNRARAGVPAIDLFNPIYGNGNPLLYNLIPIGIDTAKPSRFGFYFQDQISFNKYFQFVAGGRIERFGDEGISGNDTLKGDDTAFTGRIGAVLKPFDNFAVFGNFSNSYVRPSILAQTATANGPFTPELGRQFEGGAKAELLDRRLFVTGAIYQINKSDVLRPDPNFGPTGNNFNALLQIGEVRNRGFDLDVTGAITPRWNVTFNYSRIDSEILEDIDPNLIGKPLANVSPNTVGFFTRYDLTRKIGVGFSGEFVDDRLEPFAGIKAPAYKVFDLSYYQTFFKRFRLNLKLENIADKKYAVSSLFAARAGNFPGQPRTFSASLTILSFKKE